MALLTLLAALKATRPVIDHGWSQFYAGRAPAGATVGSGSPSGNSQRIARASLDEPLEGIKSEPMTDIGSGTFAVLVGSRPWG